jgi:hypothetical protein
MQIYDSNAQYQGYGGGGGFNPVREADKASAMEREFSKKRQRDQLFYTSAEQNDRTMIANADQNVKDVQARVEDQLSALKGFSETVSTYLKEQEKDRITGEMEKASMEVWANPSKFQFEIDEFEKGEQTIMEGQAIAEKATADYEAQGGSPIIGEQIRTNYTGLPALAAEKARMQKAALYYPAFHEQARDYINGAGSPEERTGRVAQVTEQFMRQAGVMGASPGLLNKYLFKSMRKYQIQEDVKWEQTQAEGIRQNRLNEAKDTLYLGMKTGNLGDSAWDYWQTRMGQGLSSAQAREELASFLKENEGVLTPDDIQELEEKTVTWNDGSERKLGKVLGREIDELKMSVADNVGQQLEISQKQLEARRKSYKMKFDQMTSELKEPLTNDQIKKLEADYRADGLGDPGDLFKDYVTSEEQDVNQALAELQSKFDKQGYLTPNDLDGMPLAVRNSEEVQEMIKDGSALASMGKQDKKDLDNAVKGLTNKATGLKAEERNSDVYYGAERRIRSDLEAAFRRELMSGRFTNEDGTTDYAAALGQAEAKIREKIDQGTEDYTKAEVYDARTGSAASQERIKGLRKVMKQDPGFFTRTNISTEQELSQAQRQIMTGQGGFPSAYVDMARGLKNITPYDIAMGQLNVNKIKVNPPAIEEDVKKQDAAVQELLNFHNTPNRTARAFTPDMSAPETITLGKTNLSPTETAFIATVRQLEGTAGPQGYNTWFGGRTDLDLSTMTVSEVVSEQKRRLRSGQATYNGLTSAAVGAGQFMRPEETVREMGLDPSKVRYTPQLQDAMILHQALKRRGVDPKKVLTVRDMSILGGEWASFTPQYGQTKRTAAQSLAVYQANLRRAQGGA